MKYNLYIFLFLVGSFGCQSQPKETYPDLIKKVETKRKAIQLAFQDADSIDQDSLIDLAQAYLFEEITTDFFEQWDGTEWDFNGTTRTPREGKIACGYFITTVLQDAGFNIPRTYWAQQASEYYIKRMTSDIKRFSNKPIQTVMEYFSSREDGLYIVGLDNHVGFVYKKGKVLRFVHASYYNPKIGVQSEKLNSDNPLSNSAYRVIGRILDDSMIKKWILNEEWSR